MFSDYVGIPFKHKGMTREGCSCWGLVRLIIGEQRGVWLPTYGDAPDAAGSDELASFVAEEKCTWSQVLRTDARSFDAIILFDRAAATHIGVVTRAGWFLHVSDGRSSTIERYDSSDYARVIEGFYRHQLLQ